MARECEAEILAGLRGEGACIEEESASGEAFSIGKFSQTRELPSDRDSTREGGGESASKRASGEEVEEGAMGQPAPLCQFGVG
jgi:hypothetical protein